MSRTGQNPDQQSIDAILKSLSSRPNVHATLIISRKDGSIIRATGLGDSEGKGTPNTSLYGSAQANESSSNSNPQVALTDASQPRDTSTQDKEAISTRERLAASIHDFVVMSSRLAANIAHLGTQDTTTGTESLSLVSNGNKEPNRQSTAPQRDEDVQLLRMRTKRHEIIIYPDSNYLCCVVQTTSSKENRPQ